MTCPKCGCVMIEQQKLIWQCMNLDCNFTITAEQMLGDALR